MAKLVYNLDYTQCKNATTNAVVHTGVYVDAMEMVIASYGNVLTAFEGLSFDGTPNAVALVGTSGVSSQFNEFTNCLSVGVGRAQLPYMQATDGLIPTLYISGSPTEIVLYVQTNTSGSLNDLTAGSIDIYFTTDKIVS